MNSIFLLNIFCFIQCMTCIQIPGKWNFSPDLNAAIKTEESNNVARNTMTGAGVVITSASLWWCATTFFNPSGIIGCAAAATVGYGASVIGPRHIAPDTRYTNCSATQYEQRFHTLLLKIVDKGEQNKVNIFNYLNLYCSEQCNYPTLHRITDEFCWGGRSIKVEVVKKYIKIWKKYVPNDYSRILFAINGGDWKESVVE